MAPERHPRGVITQRNINITLLSSYYAARIEKLKFYESKIY